MESGPGVGEGVPVNEFVEQGANPPVFNRQGHFGWDLVFACQVIRDVDVQIRRKAHFVSTVRNSVKEPVLPWAITSGIMWPL